MNKCGLCGSEGTNASTCPLNSTAIEQSRVNSKNHPLANPAQIEYTKSSIKYQKSPENRTFILDPEILKVISLNVNSGEEKKMENILVSDFLEKLDYYALRSLSQSSKILQTQIEKVFQDRLFREKGATVPAPWFANKPNQWLQSYDYSRKILTVNPGIKKLPDFRALNRPFGYLQAISSQESQALCLFSNSDLYITTSSLNGSFGNMLLVDTKVSQISQGKYLRNGRVYNLYFQDNIYTTEKEVKYNSNIITKIGRHYAVDIDNYLWLDYTIPKPHMVVNIRKAGDENLLENSQKTDRKRIQKVLISGKIKQVAYYRELSPYHAQVAIVLTKINSFFINILTGEIQELSKLFTVVKDQKIIPEIVEVSTIGPNKFLFRTRQKEIYEFEYKENKHLYLSYLPTPLQGQVDKLFGQHYISNNTLYRHYFDFFSDRFGGLFDSGAVYLLDSDSESMKPTGEAYFFVKMYYGTPYSPFKSFQQIAASGQISLDHVYLDPPDALGNQRLNFILPQNKGRVTILVFQHPQTGKFYEPSWEKNFIVMRVYRKEKLSDVPKESQEGELLSEQEKILINYRGEVVALTTRIAYYSNIQKFNTNHIWKKLEYL
jgi:hypothetical protein